MSTPANHSLTSEEGGTSTRLRFSSSPPPVAWAESFNDDLLVEILWRVPVKSLSRFKCVSKHWLSLIEHPDHRKKLPQTLAGFIYTRSPAGEMPLPEPSFHFTSLSGRCRALIDTSFAFLPNHRRLNLLDCCNGLLLCRHYAATGDEGRYIVCNPATEEWVMLPEPSTAGGKVSTVYLGFDPTVSSHFYVFMLLEEVNRDYFVTKVDVYSSEIGRWARKEKRWNEIIRLFGHKDRSSVFINGCIHFYAYGTTSYWCLIALDTEGETWTTFPTPAGLYNGFLHQSHGCLHYSSFVSHEDDGVHRLVVYILKDYNNKVWTLKHRVETSHISVGTHHLGHSWMAIHPECDLIFFTAGQDTKFMCYNMNRRHVKMVSNLEYGEPPYLPYVPFYAALQSLHSRKQ